MSEEIEAGWYPNPANERELRWWDGERWTDQIYHGDIESIEKETPRGNPRLVFFIAVGVLILVCLFIAFSL